MEKSKNLEMYNFWREVPKEAITKILGGHLKNFSNINPMWRIKMFTERFGPCGQGWYYELKNKQLIDGANGESVIDVEIAFYYKIGEEWSKPIPATGNSFFTQNFSKGMNTNAEATKMAITDALGNAGKHLGLGADVWFKNDALSYGEDTAPYVAPQSTPAEVIGGKVLSDVNFAKMLEKKINDNISDEEFEKGFIEKGLIISEKQREIMLNSKKTEKLKEQFNGDKVTVKTSNVKDLNFNFDA